MLGEFGGLRALVTKWKAWHDAAPPGSVFQGRALLAILHMIAQLDEQRQKQEAEDAEAIHRASDEELEQIQLRTMRKFLKSGLLNRQIETLIKNGEINVGNVPNPDAK